MKKNIYFIIILSGLFVIRAFAQNNNLNKFSYQKVKAVSIQGVDAYTLVDGNNVIKTFRNNKWELKLTSTTNYSNPYKDIVLSVHYFNEDSTKTYDSHGFWDGGSTFVIRSYFPTVGEWTWKTSCSDTNNIGLHNKSGSVFVSEYNGINKIYKHGNLKVSSNNKYLTYGDDTPFLWMGGTAWGLPISATYQEWKKYIDDRHSKKFTIVQIAPARTHGGVWLDTPIQYTSNQEGDKSFYTDDKWNPIYWQEFDRFVEYANSKEIIVVVVGLAEPVYDILTKENAKLFARNFSARMEGYHVILSPAFDTWQPYQNSVLDSTGAYLANSRHLISQHTGHAYSGGSYNEYAKYFRDKSYLDFSMNQSGHNAGDLQVIYKKAREWNVGLLNEPPTKYVINTEAFYSAGKYASVITQPDRKGTDENARAIGWLSWLSGSLGYTYGATGIWNYGEETDDNLTIPLDSAINFVSSEQMEYMVDFFNSISWWELEPIHSAIVSDEWDETKKMAFAISENGKFGVAFLPNNSSIKIDMKEFSNNVNAYWFNTFTGGYTKAEHNVLNSGYHIFTPSIPGEWVLLLNSADSIDALWTQDISVSNGNSNPILILFGKSIGATDTIDIIKGEEKLSSPSVGVFDARFMLDNNSTTLLDLRNNNESEITWTIKLQPSATGYPIKLEWDKDKLPLGSFFLRDTINGTIVNIDMKLKNSLILSNQAVTKLQIVYSEKFTNSLNYNKNWNLMSIPLSLENNSIISIFSALKVSALKYDGSYVNVDHLNNGTGYWIKHSKKGKINVYGNQLSAPINVKAGWNLIGAYAEDISTAQLETNPAGIISGNIYGFKNGYYITDTLKIGKGYWVKTNGVGEISFVNDSNLNEDTKTNPFLTFNISVTDGRGDSISLTFGLDSLATNGIDTNLGEAELPPAPPVGQFDVRIKMQDTLLNSYSDIRYPAVNCYEHIINYQLGEGSNGLKLDWNLPNGITLNIKDTLGGSLFNQNFNSGKNSYLISNTSITSMKLTFCYSDVVLSQKENNSLPEQYFLLQNYPNPFNPSTKIRFGLPNESKVSLVVYNVLGEQIVLLVNKQLKAGFHEVEFNNQKHSSGIYFYRLQTDEYVETKKMILLK